MNFCRIKKFYFWENQVEFNLPCLLFNVPSHDQNWLEKTGGYIQGVRETVCKIIIGEVYKGEGWENYER